MRQPPARVGQTLTELVTPCLLVHMPALEANDAAMRGALRGTGVHLRPHFKAHKSSALARWQLGRAPAGELRGFCAQTVGEAAALVGGGATDVLLTNELPRRGAESLAALAAAHPAAQISALVDCAQHVETLDRAARAAGASLGALVEIECGQDRCGCAPASDAAVEAARAIVAAEGLRWGGLHVYSGWIQHMRSADERRAAVAAGPAAAATSTVARLAAEGIDVPCVTGGGTGTYAQDLLAGTHTELQPGSYLFMDGDYGANEDAGAFAQSMYVHTTVVSADEDKGKRVLDAGAKAVDLVCGPPRATALGDAPLAEALGGATFASGGDEHGVLRGVPRGVLPVGATLQLVPSHVDPTANLHDFWVAVRDGAVEAVWPVDGRGPG